MDKKYDLRKDGEEWVYRRHLLEALLVSSVSENSFKFPTIQKFILSEVMNGAIEYVGGVVKQIDYNEFKFEEDALKKELWRYFKSEMKTHSKEKLNPKVEKAIDKLCKYHFVNPTIEPDEQPTELYDHFKGSEGLGICPVFEKSSFSLPQEILIKVKKFLPLLSNTEKRDINGIGKAMRKYIDEDLKFIEQTYHW